MRTLTVLGLIGLLAACSPAEHETPAPAVDAAAPVLEVEDWPLPAPDGAAQPDLVRAPDGDLLLSWLEPDAGGHALFFSRWAADAWSGRRQIARGSDWFVNWADFPHILATADGALWAHWLQKSAAATYAYDVALVRSVDQGESWSVPVLVNDDGTPTEHGFVSLWPAGSDGIGIAWLDGREMAHTPDAPAGSGHEGHAAHGGAMTLRAARFDAGLQRLDEARIDGRVCDCCQTAVAITDRGPLLLYRDRGSGEVRDIAAARLEEGAWTGLGTVHDDGWEMRACPVNGPAVAASGTDVVAAWYTAAGGTPQVRLARSADAGDRFDLPLIVDEGEAVQGRVDVALTAGAAWVLWLREEAGGQSLWLARYGAGPGEPAKVELATLQGRGRGTGFPHLVADGDGVRAVWTEVAGGIPALRGARVRVVQGLPANG